MKNYVVIYFMSSFCSDLDDYERSIEFKNIVADSVDEAENLFIEDMEHLRNFYCARGLNTNFFYDVLIVCLASAAYFSLVSDCRLPKEVLLDCEKNNTGGLYELFLPELRETLL